MSTAPAGNYALMQRADHYMGLFRPSQSQLRRCLRGFMAELQCGLEMHAKDPNSFRPAECSMMMLDSCVDFVPTGRERGIFYAIDFGGTNLRAIRCSLDGEGHAALTTLAHNLRSSNTSTALPRGLLDRRATATMLFDEIAQTVEKLVQQEGDKGKEELGIGFTFSFGMIQKTINCGILTEWTKDFETGIDTNDPVIGQDVCALLDSAFQRRRVKAKTTAVLNDTVGAMLAGFYSKTPDMPPCTVGIILGTGVNGAYVQRDAKAYGYQGVVINTELGGYDKDLPRTDIDFEIDYNSRAGGRQIFEKMVSGMYIPELTRLMILRVFQNEAPQMAWVQNSFTGEACGAILNDSGSLKRTATSLEQLWSWKVTDMDILRLIQRLVIAVFRRSAAIAAVAIAGMAMATGRLQPAMGGVTVGIDGTLYVKNAVYQAMTREYLEVILDKESAKLIHCTIAEDGSAKGAAILAGTIINASRGIKH